MNKNGAIYILVFLIVVTAIWGSLADRKKSGLEKELKDTVAEMQKLTEQTSKQRAQVLGKTAGLQETLAEKEGQLDKARKELVTLRKEIKSVEAQLSACNATIQKLSSEKEAAASRVKEGEVNGGSPEQASAVPPSILPEMGSERDAPSAEKESAENDIQSLHEQLQAAEATIGQLRRKLEAANAQMIGLEKLLEEKNEAMEETSQEMDRLKINMDVLLSKIADQRDELQEIQEEKRGLVKELAARNEEVADLQEELLRQPVRE